MRSAAGRCWITFLTPCFDAGCDKAIVIVGHGGEEVMAAFAHEKRIVWVEQVEQLGTGHAAKVAKHALEKHPGDVFILAGDGAAHSRRGAANFAQHSS